MITPDDQFFGLELRHLGALRAVAETESFRGAAKQLGYSQSAVSQQIANLERIAQCQLVERSRGSRSVALTEAGELLARHGRIMLDRLAATKADMQALVNGEVADLRIGVFQSLGAQFLPSAVKAFGTSHPRVELNFYESNEDAALIDRVERGELDVTFSLAPVTAGPFSVVELFREPFVLLVPSSDRLAEQKTAGVDDLERISLIGLRDCRGTEAVEEQLARSGANIHILFRSANNETVRGLVANGVGAALVPSLLVDPTDSRLHVLDLDFPVPERTVVIVSHRDRLVSPAADAFVHTAMETANSLGMAN